MSLKERLVSKDILKEGISRLKEIPDESLLNRGAQLAEVLELQMTLGQSNSSVVSLLLEGIDDFHSYDHLPSPDVYDSENGFQYYYHSHKHSEREEHEHGHFHLFSDLRKHEDADKLIPEGMSREKRILTHLLAFSVDNRGQLGRIFTVNSWVADDLSLPKEVTFSLLRNFRIQTDIRYPQINNWLYHLVQATLELSDLLIAERERVIHERAFNEDKSEEEILLDKNLEVPSSVFLSVPDWALALDEEAERRGIELLSEEEAA